MGYIINKYKEIVTIGEPAKVGLSSNLNFVEIKAQKKETAGSFYEVRLQITGSGLEFIVDSEYKAHIENNTNFTIKQAATGNTYNFIGKPSKEHMADLELLGVTDPTDYSGFSLFTIEGASSLDEYIKIIARNIKECLSNHPFFKDDYNILLDEDALGVVRILSKYQGEQYLFTVENANPLFMNVEHQTEETLNYIKLEIINTDVEIINTRMTLEKADNTSPLILKGTRSLDEVDSTTFHLNADKSITAENIKDCMLKNSSIKSYFEISIPFERDNGNVINGTTLEIRPKTATKASQFKSIEVNPGFIRRKGWIYNDAEKDALLGDNASVEIQLDIYKDVKKPYGTELVDNAGTYVTTLSKTYFGKPLWFDMNSLWVNQGRYSDAFLGNEKKWTSPDTVTDFRFSAKRYDGANTETFYYSDVLYAITGYGRNLDKTDMTDYTFDATLPEEGEEKKKIRPLTRQPALTHIKDQTQYFNFILANPQKDEKPDKKDKLGIIYRFCSQSGIYIGKKEDHIQDIGLFDTVNTISLDIDSIIEEYPRTGIVEVYLSRNGEVKSEPLIFNILPECLYKVNDFAFLNSLGGWSSFNFGGTKQTDFKSDTTSIYRTQTPGFTRSSRIEEVFNKQVTEQFVVQTLPISAEVADWLKEMSASVAVYELSTKRYVIIDELNIKHNTKDDLFTLQMKYHYSDSYNG